MPKNQTSVQRPSIVQQNKQNLAQSSIATPPLEDDEEGDLPCTGTVVFFRDGLEPVITRCLVTVDGDDESLVRRGLDS